MPTLPSTMFCRPARSCNSPQPRMSRCNAPIGSMSNGVAISAIGSSGTTAHRSPSMIRRHRFMPRSAPADIDAMLDKLVTQLGLRPAAGRLSLSRPLSKCARQFAYGFDLGRNDVDGRSCRALAFVEKDIDWQIWIQEGPQLVPVQAGDYLQDAAGAAAIQRRIHRLGLRTTHRGAGVHSGLPPGTQKIPFETVAASK